MWFLTSATLWRLFKLDICTPPKDASFDPLLILKANFMLTWWLIIEMEAPKVFKLEGR
jgi:hypothetical protein